MASRPRPTTGTISILRRFFRLYSFIKQYVLERLPRRHLAHHHTTGTKAEVLTAKLGLGLNSLREERAKDSSTELVKSILK